MRIQNIHQQVFKRLFWFLLLRKFWAPVPWMLEATIGLQFALGKNDESAIISLLPAFMPCWASPRKIAPTTRWRCLKIVWR
jgi:hypothetical protein